MKKKWLKVLICCILCVGLLSAPVMAAGPTAEELQGLNYADSYLIDGVRYFNVPTNDVFKESTTLFLQELLGADVYDEEGSADDISGSLKSVASLWQYLAFHLQKEYSTFADFGARLAESMKNHVSFWNYGEGIQENTAIINPVQEKVNIPYYNGVLGPEYTDAYFNHYSTGLQDADSLADADDQMRRYIKEWYDYATKSDGNSRDELDDIAASNEELAGADNSGEAFYVLTGAFNDQSGLNNQGHYLATGVVFSNFSITTLIPDSENDNYVRNITETENDATPRVYASNVQNLTGETISAQQNVTDTVRTTATSEVNGSSSYGFEESLSATYNTKAFPFGNFSVSVGFTANQAFEKGWSNSESVSEDTSTSYNVSIELPPYTNVMMSQQQGTSKNTAVYYCPVALNFTVTMVEYYLTFDDDNSELVARTIATFGGDAREDLYQRAVVENGLNDKDGINWLTDVMSGSDADLIYNKIISNNLTCKVPMSVTGAKFTTEEITMNSKVNGLSPVHPLEYIDTVDGVKEYNMVAGDILYLDSIDLEGTNMYGAPYYGFSKRFGEWKIVDTNGDPVPFSDGDIAEIKEAAVSGYDILETKEDVLNSESIYIKYFIEDNKYSSVDQMGSNNVMNFSTTGDLTSTAVIKVNISAEPFEGTVEALSAVGGLSIKAKTDTSIQNLIDNDLLYVAVRDADGKEISGAPVEWISLDSGLVVKENSILYAEKQPSELMGGMYRLVAKYGDVTSDPVFVLVQEEPKLAEVIAYDNYNALSEPHILGDVADCGYHPGDPQMNCINAKDQIDLNCIEFSGKDQYGQFLRPLSEAYYAYDWKFEPVGDSPADGIEITSIGYLKTLKAGTYDIYFKVQNVWSENALRLEVKPAREPAVVTLTEPEGQDVLPDSYILGDGTDSFDLSDLQIAVVDQYGDAMNVDYEWEITPSEGATITDDDLTVTAAGTYAIAAKAGNITSEPLTLEVLPARTIAAITLEDAIPDLVYNYEAKDSFDLSSIVAAKDQYGEDYPVAAYEWILGSADNAVPNAKIEGNVITGVLIGTDTIYARVQVGTDDNNDPIYMESNKVSYRVISNEITYELYYNGGAAIVREGTPYDLTAVPLASRNQHGEIIALTDEQKANIQWSVHADSGVEGTISQNVLIVTEGSVPAAGSEKIRLQATLEMNGYTTTADYVLLDVRQKAALAELFITAPEGLVLRNGDNISLEEFTVTAKDQYGDDISVPSDIIWTSSDPDVIKVVDNNRLEALAEDASATITATSGNVSDSVTVLTQGVSRAAKVKVFGLSRYAEYNTVIDLNNVQVKVFDQYGNQIEDLASYPISILWSMNANGTNAVLSEDNMINVGDLAGVFELTAIAVNSATGDTIETLFNVRVGAPFSDISGHWAEDSIWTMIDHGLMVGVADGLFDPDGITTRAMVVAMIYRLQVLDPDIFELTPTQVVNFADVALTDWYYESAVWAGSVGIVAGVDDVPNFAPNANITREQLVSMLWRYAKAIGMNVDADADLGVFTDSNDISSYAVDPMKWAVSIGLVKGYTDGTVAPQNNATRAEISAIFERFVSYAL